MARSRRLDHPGSWHHVMQRGAGRRRIFRDDADRHAFLALVAELDDRFDVEVHAFCLMGNHVHLLVRSTTGRLSEAMQWLWSVYTRRANHFRGTDGPIFRGRFHSVGADDPRHRHVLGSYIHANPLDLGWERPLVDYRWSSLRRYATPERSDRAACALSWVYTDALTSSYGSAEALVAAAERRRLDPDPPPPLQLVSDTSSHTGVREMLGVMNGVDGAVHSRGILEAVAIAIAVDDLDVDRVVLGEELAITACALRSRLSRGRRLRRGEAATVTRATVEALLLVSDTSGHGGSVLGHV